MTKQLSVLEVSISNLVPNDWNTNHVSAENEEKIKESLKRFGMFRPIIAREIGDNLYEILGGQHRWQVAKKLGYETIPVVNLGLIDDKTAKEIGLVDNGRYGEDDTFELAELLKELGDSQEIMSFMPYTDDEFDNIFQSANIVLDLDIDDDDETNPLSMTDVLNNKAVQTHQVMRFKVPVEDAEAIQKQIEMTMRTQNFTDEDSLANAGNALVHLLRNLK